MNERVVRNPNFKNNGEFHRSLMSRGKGAKDYPNTHTEVEHLGGGKFAASIGVGHRVFFDKADGNKPKKHKVTDNRPDHVLIQSAKCCVEVYPYYAKYFDVQHEEVRLYEERWVVQRWREPPGKWFDVSAWNPVISVEEYPEPAGDVVKVTVTYDTDYGTLIIEYFQRDGNNLKHNVTFKNTSGSTETFRVLQRWAGIVADRVNKEEITAPKETFEYGFLFEKERGTCIRENLSSFIPTWQEEVEAAKKMWLRHGECNGCGKCCLGCQHYTKEYPHCKVYETRPELCREFPWNLKQVENIPECLYTLEATGIVASPTKLQPVILDIHPQGLKADFVYGDWILAQGESLEIDPDTATLTPPTEDGHIHWDGAYTRQNTEIYCIYGAEASKGEWIADRRAYVEWDISSLAGVSLTANPIFKYNGSGDGDTDGEINPLTEEQPSIAADADLYGYIASGTAYVDPFNIEKGTGKQVGLGSSAKSDLQSAIDASQSWWAIGFQSPGDEGGSLGDYSTFYSEDKTDAADPKPTLYVEYTLAPVGIQDKSPSMAAKMIGAGLL